ncbi:MAG: ABC transporter permease subunit [Myxococcota bacterium]
MLLTASALRRLLREGLVLRSMLWPGLVVCLTLACTLMVLAAFRPARTVVVSAALDPELRAALEASDFLVIDDPDPAAAVRRCRPTIGIETAADGTNSLWVCRSHPSALVVEAIVRQQMHAPWRPVAPPPPDPKTGTVPGGLVCRIFGVLFVLYGLVFGLGGVARDRDDGSLEAELSLPIPRWIGGLARWLASSLILGAFYTLTVLAFASVFIVDDAPAVIRHGVAASSVGVALGLAVVGTAGLKNGFSGPLGVGMTAATALVGAGASWQLDWLPLASLLTRGDGWAPLGIALGIGLASARVYGWRAGGG